MQIDLHGWSLAKLEHFSSALHSLLMIRTAGEYNRIAISLQAGGAISALAGLEAWRLIHSLAAPRNYQRAESIRDMITHAEPESVGDGVSARVHLVDDHSYIARVQNDSIGVVGRLKR